MANINIKKNGFVLAFSLLISSIVLALAFTIFNILLKQITLTSLARDSQIAFYAADAGAECALYWDTHTTRDPSGFPNGQFPYSYTGMFALSLNNPELALGYPTTGQVDIELRDPTLFLCGESMIVDDFEFEDTTNVDNMPGQVTVSNFGFNLGSNVCAKVRVLKRYGLAGTFDTVIQSRGYNDCNTTNSRRVERTIEVKY